MDGGIFACPDGWEFLLPEGVAHLRDMGAVCVHRWRLLGLTPTGCRILAGERVEAELLLAPGDCSLAGFSAGCWSRRNFPCPVCRRCKRSCRGWACGCCGPAHPILCEKRGVYRELLAAACKIHTKTAMTASCVSVNRRARLRAS